MVPHSISFALFSIERFSTAYLLVETCQASTLVEGITTPNVITSASSIRGENSYSHGVDYAIGASIVDKFTYFLHQYYLRTNQFKDTSMEQFLEAFPYHQLRSTHHVRTELYEYDQQTGQKIRDVGDLPVLAFFGASLQTINGTLHKAQFNYDVITQFNQKVAAQFRDRNLDMKSLQSPPAFKQQGTVNHDREQIYAQYESLLQQHQQISVHFITLLPVVYTLAVGVVGLQVYWSLFQS